MEINPPPQWGLSENMTVYSLEGDFTGQISLGIVNTELSKFPCLARSANAVSRRQLPWSHPPTLALKFFSLLFCKTLWALGGGVWYRCPTKSSVCHICHSLHLGPLCISVLIDTDCTRSFSEECCSGPIIEILCVSMREKELWHQQTYTQGVTVSELKLRKPKVFCLGLCLKFGILAYK